jgi:hypothetical protein
LADTRRLRYGATPAVGGVTAFWDSVTQVATLTRDPLDTSLVAGYNVYRNKPNESTGPEPLNETVITEAAFKDTTLVQGETHLYRVRAVMPNGDPAASSSPVTVTARSAFKKVRTFGTGLTQAWDTVGLAVHGVARNDRSIFSPKIAAWDTLLAAPGSDGLDTGLVLYDEKLEPVAVVPIDRTAVALAVNGGTCYLASWRGRVTIVDRSGERVGLFYPRGGDDPWWSVSDMVVGEDGTIYMLSDDAQMTIFRRE